MTLAILGAIAPNWIVSIGQVAQPCRRCGKMIHVGRTVNDRNEALERQGSRWIHHECQETGETRRKERG